MVVSACSDVFSTNAQLIMTVSLKFKKSKQIHKKPSLGHLITKVCFVSTNLGTVSAKISGCFLFAVVGYLLAD